MEFFFLSVLSLFLHQMNFTRPHQIEKIKMMEFLWEELTLEDKEFDSPAWHEKALYDTEKRMSEEKEKVIDWSVAKQLLRNEFK